MERLSEWINSSLGIGHSLQYKVFASLMAILLVFLARKLLQRLLLRSVTDVKIRYNWAKGFSYFGYFFLFLIIAPIWITELHSFGAFLGLLTAGLAVALKDPISNFFAWVYILIKKPFEMGDRIQIGSSEGDVLDISFFEFTLLEIKNWVEADQSTGRIIHMPNGLLFTRPVFNYNQAMDYIWNEVPLMISFESNWQKAKEILLEIEESKLSPMIQNVESKFGEAQKKYYVYNTDLNPTVYTRIKPNGVQLTLRYLCPPKKRREFEQVAMEEILLRFVQEPDIEFAYPTTRFYSRKEEGMQSATNAGEKTEK